MDVKDERAGEGAGSLPPALGLARCGAVVIGRNEGERLRRCLVSVTDQIPHLVYVDSGSTDGSAKYARDRGFEVADLDLSRPFTAARARNEGFQRLLERFPETEAVQFIDGDCELVAGWVATAQAVLDAQPDVAVVCGRNRERHPEATLFNRLCDIEWNTPVGEASACGGNALHRVAAFTAVMGFDPSLIAGEEPELCLRLRRDAWRILRIEAEMTIHDAAMTRLSQWWMRSKRAGHAYAEGAHLHGRTPFRYCVRETRSIVFWGGLLPLSMAALAPLTGGASLALLAVAYLVLTAKVYLATRKRDFGAGDSLLHALDCVGGKVPAFAGWLRFHRSRLLGRSRTLIEHKGAGTTR